MKNSNTATILTFNMILFIYLFQLSNMMVLNDFNESNTFSSSTLSSDLEKNQFDKSAVQDSLIFNSTLYINDNWSILKSKYSWCSGEGTFEVPYLISDVSLLSQNINGPLLFIQATTECIIFDNVTFILESGEGDSQSLFSFVYIEGGSFVKFQDCQLMENNYADNYDIGLFISGTQDVECINQESEVLSYKFFNIQRSLLIQNYSFNARYNENSRGLDVDNCRNISIQEYHATSNEGNIAIVISNSRDLVINQFKCEGGNGIQIQNISNGVCKYLYADQSSQFLNISASNAISIESSNITSSSPSLVTDCINFVLNNTRFQGTKQTLAFNRVENVLIKNSFFNASQEGLILKESSNIACTDNIFICGFAGIWVENSFEIVIEKNQLKAEFGVYLFKDLLHFFEKAEIIICGNDFRNCKDGIRFKLIDFIQMNDNEWPNQWIRMKDLLQNLKWLLLVFAYFLIALVMTKKRMKANNETSTSDPRYNILTPAFWKTIADLKVKQSLSKIEIVFYLTPLKENDSASTQQGLHQYKHELKTQEDWLHFSESVEKMKGLDARFVDTVKNMVKRAGLILPVCIFSVIILMCIYSLFYLLAPYPGLTLFEFLLGLIGGILPFMWSMIHYKNFRKNWIHFPVLNPIYMFWIKIGLFMTLALILSHVIIA